MPKKQSVLYYFGMFPAHTFRLRYETCSHDNYRRGQACRSPKKKQSWIKSRKPAKSSSVRAQTIRHMNFIKKLTKKRPDRWL